MTIKILFFIWISFCVSTNVFSQNRTIVDADGKIWLSNDTVNNIMYYVDKKGKYFEFIVRNDLAPEKAILDSLVLLNQYKLLSNQRGYESFEPYASVLFAIFFSKEMKIQEIRILRRDAYSKEQNLDNNIITSIEKYEKIWSKRKFQNNTKNVLYVTRTRVVVPE